MCQIVPDILFLKYPETRHTLQWRHNERDGVSNHRKFFMRRRSIKALKLRVTSLCEGNPPVDGVFSLQRSSNAKNVLFDGVIMHLNPGNGITPDGHAIEMSNDIYIPFGKIQIDAYHLLEQILIIPKLAIITMNVHVACYQTLLYRFT